MLPTTNSTNESYLDTLVHLRERIHTLNAKLSSSSNSANPAEKDPMLSTDGMALSQSDRTLLLRGKHAATQSFAFRASLSEFGQHWETMTYPQQHRHLLDYIEGQYGEHEHLEDIRAFLVQQVLKTSSGSRLVTWNGYFVERVTEVGVVKKGGGDVRVRFLKDGGCGVPVVPGVPGVVPGVPPGVPGVVPVVGTVGVTEKKPVVVPVVGTVGVTEKKPVVGGKTRVARSAGKGRAKAATKVKGGGSFQAMRNRVKREKACFFMGD